MQVIAEEHFSLDRDVNAEVMVLGITPHASVSACESLAQVTVNKQPHFLFCKNQQQPLPK